MQPESENSTLLTTKVHVREDAQNQFFDWQGKLYKRIAAFSGFSSLEILSPSENKESFWVIVQRFHDPESALRWENSIERQELNDEIKSYLVPNLADSLQHLKERSYHLKNEVTEVFVTQVSPDKEEDYRVWMAKMHQAEAHFPGFRGVYVQSPHGQTRNWITYLKFDNQENLDRWLSSPEREKVLDESKPFIDSLQSHRMISPYAGWFASVSKSGIQPTGWKQTMIVLLILFPIVMLELKYLNPLTAILNSSLGTFIGNAISVALIAWPMSPIVIWFLGWWLTPKSEKSLQINILGTILLLVLYLFEILIFWNLL